jgi:hypothetical protein
LEQKCGRDDDWQTVLGGATDCSTFYLLKSRLCVLAANGDSHMFVVPSHSIDWSSNRGDVQKKELIESFLRIGTGLSSTTMKLFYLLPGTSSKSDVASNTKGMHSMIGNYHSKVMTILYDMEDKIEKLRLSLFMKERERVGMMAFSKSCCMSISILISFCLQLLFLYMCPLLDAAIPAMSGWLRISERSELSFHRLFATATLFRYWAVLNNSLMVNTFPTTLEVTLRILFLFIPFMTYRYSTKTLVLRYRQ